jgi:serine phosphatase RsbU (regulator of sigma subunit)
MTRGRSDDLRVRGLGLTARFSLAMTFALAIVMAVAGFFLSRTTRQITEREVTDSIRGAVQGLAEKDRAREATLQALEEPIDDALEEAGIFGELTTLADLNLAIDTERLIDESVEEALNLAAPIAARAAARTIAEQENIQDYDVMEKGAMAFGKLRRFDVRLKSGARQGEPVHLYQYDGKGSLFVPILQKENTRKGMLGLIAGVTLAVVVVGAGVAVMVANRVSKPLENIIDDIRQISRGDLEHRTRVRGGGEVALLARAIDRMTGSLRASQDAELELSVREREREVAREVREALLPAETPLLPGYELSAAHVGAPEPGGDFHDYVERGDQVFLMVCDVSGAGVPGALVGATARAYLHSAFQRGGDFAESLRGVNRELARDVRRGMYVTALCVLVDPKENIATVACAGHKIPLVRYSAAEGNVRLVQPEGIALGFDKGPVFDQRLEILRVPLEPGDRLVLANTGPVRVTNADGDEFGEKALYRCVLKTAKQTPETMLATLKKSLKAHAGAQPYPADISVLILARDESA